MHGPLLESHNHLLRQVSPILPFYKWRKDFREVLVTSQSHTPKRQNRDLHPDPWTTKTPLGLRCCMLMLTQVCLCYTAVLFFTSVAHSPEFLALGHCCVSSVWRQLAIWWVRGSFLGPAHEHFNSPNMYCSLELNQYKLKVHCVPGREL